ncbi:MAG: hypothetical protein S4CHLAM37_11340 [Chlamydiia bacterium]|nr:hypothetical protein [Chlamydiia bacterium]
MISAIVLTKDSSKTLGETLRSLSRFDDVIVLDTGSSDSTIEIAKSFPNVTLHRHSFSGFGHLRNLASNYTKNDWVLSLDSDEVLTDEAFEEIESKKLEDTKVYSFPFDNYFNNKHIKWCGWYPDRHIRLFNKSSTSFSSDFVHERVLDDDMQEENLVFSIKHYSYGCISDFLEKMQRYSTLFAQQNKYKKRSSIGKALLHGHFAFFKSYILKRGILGGKEGFIISIYNAQTAYYKYLKLWEANQDATCL